MSRTSLKLLVLAATVVALGAMASVAQAGDGPVITTGPVGPPVALPLCPAVTPHATISANGPTTSVSSNGNAYYYSPQGLCRRYVVGVGTPANGQFTITVAPSVQPTNANLCNELSGDVAIYTKGFLASSFSVAHTAHLHGVWISGGFGGNYCSLEDDNASVFTAAWGSTSSTFLGTAGFLTSYRVAVGMKLNDWESVTVSAAPYTAPPPPS
jgi:hypothetical protein